MTVKCLWVAGLLAACTNELELAESDQAVVVANGVSLNGVSLNGVSLNGSSLNGVSLNGVSLNGVSLNGVSLNGVSLNGVSLNGVSLNGVSLNGTRSDTGEHITIESVGPELTATLSNGDTLAVRIAGAQPLGDLWSYDVEYATTEGWKPLCSDGALAVAGTWNTERGVPGGGAYTASTTDFTFACRGRTIAKCVELGYRRETHSTHLQTCVRLLRGDFCGDGTPYTADGTLLNMYDNLGIQIDTNDWMVEGEWTPDGARCITKPRYTRFEQVVGVKPPCALERLKDACGNFSNGAVLVDELP